MVSYHLGMMTTKLCAHELLDTPRLVHLNWMEKSGNLSNLPKSRSRADLLGESQKTGKWSLFEAKGRSGKFSQDVLDGAKTQAQMSILVDGQPLDMGIACALFTKDQLDFHWNDPEFGDEEPLVLKPTRETWKAYYGNAIALYEFQQEFPEAVTRLLNFNLDVDPKVLEFVRYLDEPENERWRETFPTFTRDTQKLEDDQGHRFFRGLDGISIRLSEEMLE